MREPAQAVALSHIRIGVDIDQALQKHVSRAATARDGDKRDGVDRQRHQDEDQVFHQAARAVGVDLRSASIIGENGGGTGALAELLDEMLVDIFKYAVGSVINGFVGFNGLSRSLYCRSRVGRGGIRLPLFCYILHIAKGIYPTWIVI